MQGTRGGRRWGAVGLLGLLLATVGCVHTDHAIQNGPPPITVPPPGAVPRELDKITFPPYVIEAPDNLLIEVIQRSPKVVRNEKGEPELKDGKPQPIPGAYEFLGLQPQPVSGSFLVRLDGTVGLGFWGAVPVAGLTLEQSAETIRHHITQSEIFRSLGTKPENIIVIVDVLAYNSKKYYVITDGGGYGEQVFPFPITGSECVLDAIGNIYGLPSVASKRNIWVARRTPHPGQPWQILPVDWIGITQHGVTITNYQILPGDRIYVKAQRLVTIDTMLARIISPIERVFGVTLLGANTINQIKGRGFGFGGSGGQ